jgi:hypothetical protein
MVQVEYDRTCIQIERYVVRPNTSFLTRLRASESDVACILLDTKLWSQTFGGRIVVNDDIVSRTVKLVHVAQLISELGNVEELQMLCGPLEVSIACFDQLWELIKIDDEDSVDYAIKELPEELRDKVNGG